MSRHRAIGLALGVGSSIGAALNGYLATRAEAPFVYFNALVAVFCALSAASLFYSLWRNWRWL